VEKLRLLELHSLPGWQKVQRKAKPTAQLPEPRKLRQKVKEMAMKVLAHL
jgi:hypothetical protein